MNPRLEFLLLLLEVDIESTEEVEEVTILYEYGNSSIILSYDRELITREIPIKSFITLIKTLTNVELTISKLDFETLFDKDSHRKVLYIRAIVPDCICQIGYEDDDRTFNFGNEFSELLREMLH